MAFTWGKGSLFLASTYWLNIWCNDGQTGIRRWRWFLVFLIVITLFSRFISWFNNDVASLTRIPVPYSRRKMAGIEKKTAVHISVIAGHKRITHCKNGKHLFVREDVWCIRIGFALWNSRYITRKTYVIHILCKLCQYRIFATNRFIAVINQSMSPFVYQYTCDKRSPYLFFDEEPIE